MIDALKIQNALRYLASVLPPKQSITIVGGSDLVEASEGRFMRTQDAAALIAGERINPSDIITTITSVCQQASK